MADIDSKLKKIINEKLGVEESEINRDTNFINDLGADSLDTVELIMAIEQEFNITIPDDEAEGIVTFGDAYDYVDNKYIEDEGKA